MNIYVKQDLRKLGDCNIIQTDRSLFDEADLAKLEIERNGQFSWSGLLFRLVFSSSCLVNNFL